MAARNKRLPPRGGRSGGAKDHGGVKYHLDSQADSVAQDPVAVPAQAEIRVYTFAGDIAIWQDGGPLDEDALILVAPSNAAALAEAILREAGTKVVTKAPTKSAERARAYRQRKRERDIATGTPERDAEQHASRDANANPNATERSPARDERDERDANIVTFERGER